MTSNRPPSRPLFNPIKRHVRAGEEVRWLSRVSKMWEAGVVVEKYDAHSYAIASAGNRQDAIVVRAELLRVRPIN